MVRVAVRRAPTVSVRWKGADVRPLADEVGLRDVLRGCAERGARTAYFSDLTDVVTRNQSAVSDAPSTMMGFPS